MSHEIRTPMNAIIGMISIGLSSDNYDKMKDCFHKIDNSSKHLLGIINNILDMSKIESGKFDLSETEFDFMKMVQQAIAVNKPHIDEKKQILTINIDKAIPPYLYGDSQRLSQVITNLINNAVKFTPEGGSISVDVQLLDKVFDICSIKFSVIDSGIGISKEQQAKLFTSFQQAENSISRKYGGTGLGLAISRNIVEMMGGKIWIESELGEGTTFAFTIQIRQSTLKQAEKTTDEEIIDRFDGHCILLVEDIEINREIIITLLAPTLLTVECAENGKEALDMFEAAPEKYELIFMDMQMPEMDGLEATRRIRALDVPYAKTVPIIALTANAFREDVIKCLDAGMNGHLGKPLEFDAVLSKLRSYLTEGVSGGIIWDRKYEFGNNRIDGQHKSLCDMVNNLIRQCEQGKAAETIQEAMGFLSDYTTYHFDSEETLQVEIGYTGYKEHKKIHEEFKVAVGQLLHDYKENGSSEELLYDIRETVIKWLTNHIQNEDTKIIDFLRKQESNTSGYLA